MAIRMPRIIHSKRILRRSSSATPVDVPKGYVVVYVGHQEKKRFVIPISFLNQPSFHDLLNQSEEEFGAGGNRSYFCKLFWHRGWVKGGSIAHQRSSVARASQLAIRNQLSSGYPFLKGLYPSYGDLIGLFRAPRAVACLIVDVDGHVSARGWRGKSD
ncbi:hypothetical protein LguiA_009039 [Lonicera macranthoides]